MGSGSWQYDGWTPSSTGSYTYIIYIQDNEKQWMMTTGSIQVTNAPLIDTNTLWIIIIVAIVVGVAVTVALLYYRSRNAKSQLTKPPVSNEFKPIPFNIKPVQPSASSLKFCIFCGSEVEQDATFCTQCGKQQR